MLGTTFKKESTMTCYALNKILLVAMIFLSHNLIAQNLDSSDFDERYISYPAFDSAKNPPKSMNPPKPNAQPKTLTMTNFNFDLEKWLPRLVQIVNSTDGSTFALGVCGTCLLQSYQMAAEILLYGNNPPTQGGYFFDTAPNTNPFVSFRQRHSLLYYTLNDIVEYYVVMPALNPQERFANSARVAYASAISLLPQYHWQYLGLGTTQSDINRLLGQVLQGSVGSLYITSMVHQSSAGVNTHHSVLLVRTSGGVRVLQTNVTGAPDYYLRYIARENASIQSLRESLNQVGAQGSQLIMIGISQVSGRYDIPFASALSFSDCTGNGDTRRGNAQIPSAAALNQCASGRCNQ